MTKARNGQEIVIDSGIFNENISMKSGVDVIGAGRDVTTVTGPVWYSSDSNTILRDLFVQGRINVTGGAVNLIYKVKSSHLDYYGVNAIGSSPYIDRFYSNISPHYGYAIYAHNSSYPDVVSSYITNKIYGIFAQNSSEAYVEDTYFCSQTDLDIFADTGCYVDAEDDDNIFSGDPDDYTSGNVDYPYSWVECGLIKAAPRDMMAETFAQGEVVNIRNEAGFKAYKQAAAIVKNIRKNMLNDYKARGEYSAKQYNTEYESAISMFKAVVDDYPGSASALLAAGQVSDCYRTIGQPESAVTYLGSLATDKGYSTVQPEIENMLIIANLDAGKTQEALALADKVSNVEGNDLIACEGLYQKGIIYRHYLNDEAKAAEAFSGVVTDYPEFMTSLSAQLELEDMGKEVPKPENIVPEDITFSASNFPNPFNPETTIQYALPESGHIKVQIFDIQGRLVRTLVNATMNAGAHQVIWNSRDQYGNTVASGMYFYRMQYQDQTLTQKMVLMR